MQMYKDKDISKDDFRILKETLKNYNERKLEEGLLVLSITNQRPATAIRDYLFLRNKKSFPKLVILQF